MWPFKSREEKITEANSRLAYLIEKRNLISRIGGRSMVALMDRSYIEDEIYKARLDLLKAERQ